MQIIFTSLDISQPAPYPVIKIAVDQLTMEVTNITPNKFMPPIPVIPPGTSEPEMFSIMEENFWAYETIMTDGEVASLLKK